MSRSYAISVERKVKHPGIVAITEGHGESCSTGDRAGSHGLACIRLRAARARNGRAARLCAKVPPFTESEITLHMTSVFRLSTVPAW